MSAEPPPDPYSHPTSGGGLFLRIGAVALALAVLGVVIWYMTR